MKFIDIHTHLPCEKPEILCIQNLIVGRDACNLDSSQYYSCGIHPWYLDSEEEKIKQLNSFVSHPRILAIGECGLDFREKYLKIYNKQKQIEVFSKQIEIARQNNKALIIHCVKCLHELLNLRNKYPKEKWIFHGFNKNKKSAALLIKNGIYLSYGAGILKFPAAAESLLHTPLDMVFFETDDQNRYSIEEIYKYAAKILNISLEKLSAEIQKNFEKVFKPVK